MGNGQDAGLCAGHRGGVPDTVLPALLDPLGVDEGHAPDRRLPLRQQDGLRVFAPFMPVLIVRLHQWPLVLQRARTRRCRGVPPPQRAGLHQARDRPAGRPGADGGRKAAPERSGRARHSGRHLRRGLRTPGPPGPPATVRERGAGPRGDLPQVALHRRTSAVRWLDPDAPHPQHRGWGLQRQHRRLHRARGQLLLHGRQPRQQPGQPRSAHRGRGRLRAGRAADRAGRPRDVLVRRPVDVLFWTWRGDRFFKAIE